MEYSITSDIFAKPACACLILGVFENGEFAPSAQKMAESLRSLLSRIIRRDNFKAKAGDTLLVNHVPESEIERILLVGLGQAGQTSAKAYRKALAAAIKSLKESHARDAVCTLAEIEVRERDLEWKARQIVEVFEEGVYRFTQLKSEAENNGIPESILIAVSDETQRVDAERGLRIGEAVAEGVNLTKELGNLPGNICTPSYLAEQAQKVSESYPKLTVAVLDESDMGKLGMGALLSVSKGSQQPAKLIVLEYRSGADNAKPFVLVGKGLTFDAGGISLKPAQAMDEMKYDMCGGASVLGTLAAVAKLGLPINVVGIVPASENLPDGAANKPGDIVTSLSGKTIEILNTDAEGRLLLCDALTYAKRYDPEVVIDIATLTGACVVALGKHPSGLMSNDDALCEELIRAGEKACDRAWRLPLWEDYQEQLKSNFADMANVGGRDAGAVTAACFLSRYTEGCRWAHLDIAGTAWLTGNSKGATGRPVPLLTQYLIDRTQ